MVTAPSVKTTSPLKFGSAGVPYILAYDLSECLEIIENQPKKTRGKRKASK